MASSGNFGTWNPLNIGSGGSTSLTVGNTNAVMTGADPRTTGTVGGVISDTDGYYFETVATSTGSGALTLGIVNEDRHNQCMAGQIHSRSGSFMWRGYSSGQFFVETSTNTSYGTFADGDIIGWFVKNSKLYVKKNNSDVVGDVVNTSAGIDISGGFFFPAVSRTVGGGSQTSSILRTDSNDWSYSPPDGFKGLTSKDMLISSDIDPAETSNDYPGTQFNTITWTGNRSNNSTVNNITGVGFQPDLVWLKFTEQTYDWRLVDSSRGVTEAIRSNQTTEEQTEANGLYQFGSDGFSVKGDNNYNYNGGLFIGYCWRANGGTTASNSDGDITSTVQANTNAGFSIVTYTGDNTDHRGVGYGSANIGHGLDSAPELVITKRRDGTGGWYTLHASAGVGYLTLNDSTAFQSGSVPFGPALPTTTTFGAYSANNNSSHTYVCYCFHSVDGYSKFGKFEGNGNTNGPFVYTGFRPRMIFLRRTTSGYFNVINSARDTYNPVNKYLSWNATDTEGSGANVDFLSNGFKLRTTSSGFNQSGTTFVYGAWGDVPFKYNNTF